MFTREKELFATGAAAVIGCDEVGRGCLAGPVVAAAVVMPQTLRRGWKSLVRDSKTLSRGQREEAAAFIRDHAQGFAVGEVDVATIDSINIHRASLEAMRRAADGVRRLAEGMVDGAAAVLIDGRFTIPDLPSTIHQQAIIDGDAKCLSIAAASIMAKEHRDALMRRLHEEFPQYGFDRHVGYATPQHRAALRSHGLSPHHRVTFCHL